MKRTKETPKRVRIYEDMEREAREEVYLTYRTSRTRRALKVRVR